MKYKLHVRNCIKTKKGSAATDVQQFAEKEFLVKHAKFSGETITKKMLHSQELVDSWPTILKEKIKGFSNLR